MASAKKYPNIVIEPPGPKALEWIKREEKIISPYNRPYYYPLVVESAKDCIIRDVDGNEYIDFNSGLVVMNVGHCHPKVIEAIEKQIRKLMHYSYTDFRYPYVVQLAEKFLEIVPGETPKKIFFSNSGAESVEAAIKMARWHTKRPYIIAYTGSFHGRTYMAMSLTASSPKYRARFGPLVPGVEHVPYPYCYRCPWKQEYPDCDLWCVDFIDEYYFKKYVPPEETAAIVFEPIQGEGGYIPAPDGYFKKLKKLADQYGILLVDDDVQAGMGRTGKWFGIEHYGIEPDILCTSKGTASGLSLGVTVAKADVMDWGVGVHCTTFGGNPVACAAAMAVIDIIKEERLLENAARQGEYIMKRFKEAQESLELIGDVRGKGLMIGVELVKDRKTKEPAVEERDEVMRRSWKKGVAIIGCGASTLRIAPPLTITRELVDTALDIIIESIKEVETSKV